MSNNKKYIYLDDFLELTTPLLLNSYVQSMTTFDHHLGISTHFHSLNVAYHVYCHCRKYNIKDTDEITIASLLHDFYLYDWPTQKHEENHIYYHPKEAVRNIERTGIINLTEMQRNMILNHMFPCAHIPDSRGGWILTATDKYCATRELVEKKKCFEKTYNLIMERVNNVQNYM